MIVFLYGPDSYRRLARKRFYRDQFEKKYGKPAQSLDLETEDALGKLAEAGSASSLFGGKELFILENAFTVEAKALLPVLALFAENKEKSLLLSEDEQPVKALGFLLKKPVVAEEFKELEGAPWTTFVKKEAEVRGVKLDQSALQLLATAYRKDSWGLVTELEKLSHLKGSVSRATLASFGVEEPEGNYWALLNGLRSERGGVRLGTLERLFAMGEPAAKIFNILGPLWSSRVREFARYDEAIKTGKLEYEEALADAVLA